MIISNTKDRTDGRILENAELDAVSGGSIFDGIGEICRAIISPRDASSGLPTGKRMHD